MPDWADALDILGLFAFALVAVAAWLVIRRRWVGRHGGTFDLCVRVRPRRAGRGWVLGMGRYHEDDLEWFRIFSLSMRPKRVFHRPSFEVVDRRGPEGREVFALYDDAIVVDCRVNGGSVQLALSEDALTGMLAWLEAAPPGQDLRSS
ncbi:MAG: DUF2550 family protein [Propionibacteriales bacterium]|nr:DUF2550 family protein [Propionibacteriales bacterium]